MTNHYAVSVPMGYTEPAVCGAGYIDRMYFFGGEVIIMTQFQIC